MRLLWPTCGPTKNATQTFRRLSDPPITEEGGVRLVSSAISHAERVTAGIEHSSRWRTDVRVRSNSLATHIVALRDGIYNSWTKWQTLITPVLR